MFKKNFIVALKVNGKVLREVGEKVFLPFGKEYTIYLKNQNSRDAVADITIDGKSVINGLIVRANSCVEVERFYEENSQKGHKLKFIEKTSKISEHRGDFAEDGLLRVEWRFEKEKVSWIPYFPPIEHHHHHHHYDNIRWWYQDNTTVYGTGGVETLDLREKTGYSATPASLYSSVRCCNDNQSETKAASTMSVSKHEDVSGITVNGDYSNQKFSNGYVGTLEDERNVICLKMVGETSKGLEINNPVTVEKKIKCPTCGRKNKGYHKFCCECGTCLV